MPKAIVLPAKIRIHDELGQPWDVDKEDDLWPDVLKLTNNGTATAIIPLSVIVSKRGWGWWSCFKTQDDWLANSGILVPDHHILDSAANGSLNELAQLLQKFGADISWLEAQIGFISGRRNALKQAYDAAVMVQTSGIDKGAERAKEAQVLSDNETLKQAKRLYIESDMLLETAKGMCAAYVRAWETTSRLITIKTAEMELQPRRTP